VCVYIYIYIYIYIRLYILLCCYLEGIFVDELKKEVSNHQSIVSRKNPNGAKAPSYPENYKTCMNFFGLVRKAVPVGM
jgi:hypothetical protein